MILKRSRGPISAIIVFLGIRVAIVPLKFSQVVTLFINRALSTFVILIATYVVISVFDVLIDNWGRSWAMRTKSRIDEQILILFRKLSRTVIGILGLMFVLSAWGIEIGPLLAGLGVAGIAIAFALQNTLGNIFGGISMIIDKTIKVGDMIRLDADTTGIVLDIGMRSTKVKTFDNEVLTIPNGQLANSRVLNIVPPDPTVRLVLPVSVAYGSDIEKVKKTIIKAVDSIKHVMREPEKKKPMVRFVEMGDSALKFNVYIWVDHYLERFNLKDIANTNIYNALNKAGIAIPFPQMDVHLKKGKK